TGPRPRPAEPVGREPPGVRAGGGPVWRKPLAPSGPLRHRLDVVPAEAVRESRGRPAGATGGATHAARRDAPVDVGAAPGDVWTAVSPGVARRPDGRGLPGN